MSSSKNIFLFNLIICIFSLRAVTSQNSCASVQCSVPGNEPEITYPFGNIDLQGVGCGSPGFDITCDIHDHTVLKLPQSGEFLVRKIDYAKKEIRLYDQKDCLARRLQRKNISMDLSPFKAYAYKKYHFFSCPTSVTRSNPNVGTIAIIPCLSNATNSVLVTVSLGGDVDSYTAKVLIAGGCEICASVTIPIPFTAITKISSYDFRIDDLYLTWVEPEKSEDSTKDDIKGGEGKKSKGRSVGMIVGIIIAALAALGAGLGLTVKMAIDQRRNNCNSNRYNTGNNSNINSNNNNITNNNYIIVDGKLYLVRDLER
ncbi:hypothetical protein MKW92_031311 [Papaver armeniacum]|nr:hypothetical protein MKW92_031311 [Papaver armeniacum]